MPTPLQTIVQYVQNVTWQQVSLWMLGLLGVVMAGTWKASRIANNLQDRAQTAEKYVKQMATNDLPHTFHVLLNIDKNIAKMTGGSEVDFTELEIKLAKEK